MHFCPKLIAADLAHSICGKGGKRINTSLQANRFYKRLHMAIRGLQIDFLNTVCACAPLGKSSNPSRGMCGPV